MNERISDEDLSRILEAYSLHLGRATRAAASLRAGPDAARAIVAALQELQERRETEAWRSIETAPKDGTSILIWLDDYWAEAQWDTDLGTWIIGDNPYSDWKPSLWRPVNPPEVSK